ncbi:MAG: hypothetical protein KA369_16340 [Spirochaetes bacterium]|nr:hypothetical protein [Spirochaetota bacterium]
MKRTAMAGFIFFSSLLIAATTTMPAPDHNLLSKTDFYFSCCGIGGSELKFLKNNSFSMHYMIDGGFLWYNEGTYEIAGNDIVLRPVKCRQEQSGPVLDCKKATGDIVCNVVRNDDSVFYSLYLHCRPKNYSYPQAADFKNQKFEYPVKDSAVRAGEKKRVDGIAVIAIGAKQAVTTSNVKLRAKPSVSAKEIEFRLYPDYRSLSVPAKTEITVYARTEKKEKVQNWENYWFYVKAGMADPAWMFGEFVKIK